jgi:hypothetical protein
MPIRVLKIIIHVLPVTSHGRELVSSTENVVGENSYSECLSCGLPRRASSSTWVGSIVMSNWSTRSSSDVLAFRQREWMRW